MQSGNLTVVAEVWMRLCMISIPPVKASTSRAQATSTINKRHWGLLFTAHRRIMGQIKREPLIQSYDSYRPMGKQELDSFGDPYALLLAGLEKRERVLCVEKKNMQNFFPPTRDAGFH